MNKRKNFLVVFSFLVVLVGSFVFSGCETSRVGPEVAKPNPPAPEPLPIYLTGYVLDAKAGTGIANATVALLKLDGTSVSTAATNASGLFSFNMTALNVSGSDFITSTSVAGYGFGRSTAFYDKANNVASARPISLTKIESSVTVTMGPTGGAASTPPTTDSKATTPVSVTVPANAVPAGTQVTLAAVPVVSTPPPSTTPTQNVISSNTLAAPGVTTFSQPVTMTFNLPFPLAAGTTIPLLLLNTTTNVWENTGLNGVVTANGLTATVSVTKPGSYALLGNVSVAQTVSGKFISDDGITVTKTQKVVDTQEIVVDITPDNRTYQYNKPGVPSAYQTVNVGTPATTPSQSFVYGLVQVRYPNFTQTQPGIKISFLYNLPATLKGKNGIEFDPTPDGVMKGPNAAVSFDGINHSNESGDWVYRLTITEVQILNVWKVQQSGVFEIDVNSPDYKVTYTSQWVWRAHNQGGAGLTGYNP